MVPRPRLRTLLAQLSEVVADRGVEMLETEHRHYWGRKLEEERRSRTRPGGRGDCYLDNCGINGSRRDFVHDAKSTVRHALVVELARCPWVGRAVEKDDVVREPFGSRGFQLTPKGPTCLSRSQSRWRVRQRHNDWLAKRQGFDRWRQALPIFRVGQPCQFWA
jgi:hypothetical protein